MSSDFQERLKRLNASAAFNFKRVNKAARPASTVLAMPVEEPAVPTISSLKSKTFAITASESGMFVYMRIISPTRPISLTQGDGWLAGVEKEKDVQNKWRVSVWRSQLAFMAASAPDEQDRRTAGELTEIVNAAGNGIWIYLDTFPAGADMPKDMRPPALG